MKRLIVTVVTVVALLPAGGCSTRDMAGTSLGLSILGLAAGAATDEEQDQRLAKLEAPAELSLAQLKDSFPEVWSQSNGDAVRFICLLSSKRYITTEDYQRLMVQHAKD